MGRNTEVKTMVFFGKTREVVCHLHNCVPGEEVDHVLWVERAEDEYALLSPGLRDKKVAIVYREDWLNAELHD